MPNNFAIKHNTYGMESQIILLKPYDISKDRLAQLMAGLGKFAEIQCWTIDWEDIDHVIRIVALPHTPLLCLQIIEQLQSLDIICELYTD